MNKDDGEKALYGRSELLSPMMRDHGTWDDVIQIYIIHLASLLII